jgi:hypothetical protein
VLIILVAVLIVLCLLILPWFCSSETTNKVPSQLVPIKPELIYVEPTIPANPGVRSTPNNSAATEAPTVQENPSHIDHTETITTTTNQKAPGATCIEPTTPTPINPDFPNVTSPTNPDLQDNSTPTVPDEPDPTEPIVQEEIEPTSENPLSPIPEIQEEQKDEDDQTSLRNPRVVPRNIPDDPTNKLGEVSQEEQPLSPISPNHNINSGKAGLILWVVVLVILLICYIIARVRSKRGDLVITANIFDKILIILSPILFFVAWCIGFDHELTPLQIILLILSGLMLIGSILFSIFANLGNIFHIIISILAKIFIFIFTNFLLLLLVVIVLFSFMRAVTSHNDTEGTYVMKYDHFLDQWVGYRID